ncbi:MAG: phosphatidylinositol kinase [Acidimicrobiia bacterium]|nr:phosphatidylinositol kinase [Acidimicrobiia bacterium]
MTETLEITDVLGRLPHASNTTLLARLSDDSLAVYKPERGERPLWDFDFGTLAAREALTYEVSAAMGLAIIPRTLLLDGPLGRGSVQTLVDEDTDIDPRYLLNGPVNELWPMAVLDIVTNNADRKLGHILIEKESGLLWGIDNGLTFHAEDKLRTMLWGFAGRPLPDSMHAALARLSAALTDGLEDRIEELLSPEEARAVRQRVDDLLAAPRHPHPPDDRPAVPWPMW